MRLIVGSKSEKLADEYFNYNSAKEMELSRLANAYLKLKPFLKAIPLHYDSSGYGWVPVDYNVFSELASGERGDGECPRHEDFKIAAYTGEIAVFIMWMPDDDRFEHPTFSQFMAAYSKQGHIELYPEMDAETYLRSKQNGRDKNSARCSNCIPTDLIDHLGVLLSQCKARREELHGADHAGHCD